MLVEQVPPSLQHRYQPASADVSLSLLLSAGSISFHFISFHFFHFSQSSINLCVLSISNIHFHFASIIHSSSIQLLKGMPWQLQQSLAAATEPHTHPEPRTSAAKPASCSGKGGLERGICPSSISRLWSALLPLVNHTYAKAAIMLR